MFTLLLTACRMFSNNKEILEFRNIFHWYNQSLSDMPIEVDVIVMIYTSWLLRLDPSLTTF